MSQTENDLAGVEYVMANYKPAAAEPVTTSPQSQAYSEWIAGDVEMRSLE